MANGDTATHLSWCPGGLRSLSSLLWWHTNWSCSLTLHKALSCSSYNQILLNITWARNVLNRLWAPSWRDESHILFAKSEFWSEKNTWRLNWQKLLSLHSILLSVVLLGILYFARGNWGAEISQDLTTCGRVGIWLHVGLMLSWKS